jgi:hypothetical protein
MISPIILALAGIKVVISQIMLPGKIMQNDSPQA